MALTDAHAVEQNELVTELGIKKGTISKAPKQLAVDGYIRREADEKISESTFCARHTRLSMSDSK